ncbi:hypothetical protein BGZ70_008510 [Mortierella alpina]|uniref:Uncharacterized protein n=1 Tax=Mortierella alpina TaxID=64518 RepID=A0A9P6M1I3_MORAP|nr:hypothetical protein BGZ70_008510 [Mortierella alpina]
MASAATEQPSRADQQPGRDMGLASDEHDMALEPEPASFNKCFVLSAIVVFLAVGCSSVPNLLSTRNPRESHRTTSLTTNYPSEAFGYAETLATHPATGVKGIILAGTGAETLEHKHQRASNSKAWNPVADGALENEHKEMKSLHHQGSDRPSTRQNAQVQAISSPSTSPIARVSTPPAGSQQEPYLRAAPPPRLQETNIWPLIQGCIWLVLRGSLWSMRTSFRLTRFVVSKPVSAFLAVAEPPYIIVRDICRAFLPVYSFFAVAAVVGIVVGGSATWIAQQLIAALGADKEASNLSHMNTDVVSLGPAHASTTSHGRPVFAYQADSFTASDEEFRSGTSGRRGPAQLGTKATAHMPEASPHHKRGPTMTEVENDYGDDDDDDDDDDEGEGDDRERVWHGP